METIGSKRSYALIWCTPNNDDDDDFIFKCDCTFGLQLWSWSCFGPGQHGLDSISGNK